MRSMSMLAVFLGAPLMLAASPAYAAGPAAPPEPSAPAAATPAVATPAPAAASPVPAAAVATPDPAPGTAPAVLAPGPANVKVEAVTAEKPAVADGLVEVHIQTKELVALEHRTGPDAAWQVACETPCDTRLPAGDEYRVTGRGLNDSEVFALTSPKGNVVRIHVAPGFTKRERIGKIMTIGGGVVLVGAVVIGLAAADPSKTFNADGSTNNYNWNVIAVGTGFALAGLTTAIFGASWWYDNAHTRIGGDIQGEQPAHGGIEPRYQTAFRLGAPSMTAGTTLFSHSF